MSFTNNDSIKNRISRKTHKATNSGVYVLTCKNESCDEIYVGQSQDIPKRMNDHTAAKRRPSMSHYTSVKHTKRGHELMPANHRVPYTSNSLSHRLVIETCLISLCKTIKGNTSSSNNRDMNVLGPIILRASPVNWKVISEIQPNFNSEMAPRKYQKFFSAQHQRSSMGNPTSAIVAHSSRTNEVTQGSQTVEHRYYLRSRARM